MVRGFFADKPVYRKFLIVVSIVLFCTLIFSMVAALLADAIYGVDLISDPGALNDLDNPVVLSAMKLIQLLSTGIGMFLISSVVIAILFSHQPINYLGLQRAPIAEVFLHITIIMFAAVPLINLMVEWNQQMHLPSGLAGLEEWMKASEDNAMRITEALLNMHSISELSYNLLIIAVLPALGEELLFRGILQRLFKELTGNIHWAIIITSVIFSAIHMQFYGFIPRMMLGILFGYIYYWTGNLWITILAHFINNGAAVIFAYIASVKELPFNQDTIGTNAGDIWMLVVSLVVLSAGLYRIRQIYTGKQFENATEV